MMKTSIAAILLIAVAAFVGFASAQTTCLSFGYPSACDWEAPKVLGAFGGANRVNAIAFPFTTGANAAGYTVNSVGAQLSASPMNSAESAFWILEGAGLPTTGSQVEVALVEYTGPTSTFYSANITASINFTLAASTTYWFAVWNNDNTAQSVYVLNGTASTCGLGGVDGTVASLSPAGVWSADDATVTPNMVLELCEVASTGDGGDGDGGDGDGGDGGDGVGGDGGVGVGDGAGDGDGSNVGIPTLTIEVAGNEILYNEAALESALSVYSGVSPNNIDTTKNRRRDYTVESQFYNTNATQRDNIQAIPENEAARASIAAALGVEPEDVTITYSTAPDNGDDDGNGAASTIESTLMALLF